jgi:hypothetical protein
LAGNTWVAIPLCNLFAKFREEMGRCARCLYFSNPTEIAKLARSLLHEGTVEIKAIGIKHRLVGLLLYEANNVLVK